MTPAHIIHSAGVERAERAGREWREKAACRDHDVALFFPASGPGKAAPDWATPKAICAGCAAKDPCLDYALTAGEDEGIWGGATPGERRELRRKRPPFVAKRPAVRTKSCKRCRRTFDARDHRQVYCCMACAELAKTERRRAS